MAGAGVAVHQQYFLRAVGFGKRHQFAFIGVRREGIGIYLAAHGHGVLAKAHGCFRVCDAVFQQLLQGLAGGFLILVTGEKNRVALIRQQVPRIKL